MSWTGHRQIVQNYLFYPSVSNGSDIILPLYPRGLSRISSVSILRVKPQLRLIRYERPTFAERREILTSVNAFINPSPDPAREHKVRSQLLFWTTHVILRYPLSKNKLQQISLGFADRRRSGRLNTGRWKDAAVISVAASRVLDTPSVKCGVNFRWDADVSWIWKTIISPFGCAAMTMFLTYVQGPGELKTTVCFANDDRASSMSKVCTPICCCHRDWAKTD